MFSSSDTIVAIATPPGRGGLGVVRISGPGALGVAASLLSRRARLEPRVATFTHVVRRDEGAAPWSGDVAASGFSRTIDDVVATYFPAPRSFTGEHVVEISAHGSPVVLHDILEAAVAAGARLAEPGEFTLRAFLNGRIDLPRAEAIRDLIEAVTPLQARAAFDQLQGTLTDAIARIDGDLLDVVARLEASVDFPDEGYHFIDPAAVTAAIDEVRAATGGLLRAARGGRVVREGLQAAIAGPVNAGKSSVFNSLSGVARAIVTDVPGTTRDLVTEVVDLEGLRVTLVDTAGLRDTADPVERAGIDRAERASAVSDLILVVLDRSRPLGEADLAVVARTAEDKRIIVANKSDLPAAWTRDDAVNVSALRGTGLEELRRRIVSAATHGEALRDEPAITNLRHIALVERADEALARARAAADAGAPEELVLADLQDARAALEEVTGRRTSDDVLAHIFANFCVGK